MIDSAFQAYLQTQLGSIQVYYASAQQTGVLPYVTFFVVSTQPVFELGRQCTLSKFMVQVDAWGNTLAQVQTLTTGIASSLDFYSGDWNAGVVVQKSLLINRFDHLPEQAEIGSSTKIYHVTSEFEIWATGAN